MKTAIVTGAAGFLGFHLTTELLKLNYKVIGLDNYVTGSKINISDLQKSSYFEFIEMDVTQVWPQELLNNKIEQVFHFASIASPHLFESKGLEIMLANSVGLKNAIDFADSCKARLIFASTSEVYGSSLEKLLHESNWGVVNPHGPRSSYDESKRFGEALIYTCNKKNNTQHGIVRIFNTYGPRMHRADQRVVNEFIKNALTNKDLVIFGDGKQTRSFCYVDDLIAGILKYASLSVTEPINIGNDAETSIESLAQFIQHSVKSSSKIVYSDKRTDDPLKRKPDLEKARVTLAPWIPAVTLTTGIERMQIYLQGVLKNDL